MAKKTVGELIREARTGAGLTQEQLAKQIEGVSAGDVSKAERGEKELTQAQLKAIAKATGVTQKSLLEAASGAKKTASTTKKTAAAEKKTAAAATKKTASTTKKAAATKKTAAKKKAEEITLTAAEKRVLELYRAASAETRKAAEALLKGQKADAGVLETLLGGALDLLTGNK